MTSRRAVSTFCAGLLLAASPFALSTLAAAQPSGVFSKLGGTWRGTGKIALANGKSQRISCRAYYKVRNSGKRLGFAIRCASPGNKIELRASLIDRNGRLSGTWEERTFNANGKVTGAVRANVMRLSIDGSVSGSMNIAYSGGRQKVSISTAAEGLKGIAINLRR